MYNLLKKSTYNFIFNTTAVINNVKDILNIYPNPNNGQFIITNSEPINEIFITDLQGKSVYSSKNLNANTLDIKLYNLEKGMYLVNILTKNGDEAVIEGIKSHLENKLKTKIDIDYNYQGAGFGFNMDKYSILTKLK